MCGFFLSIVCVPDIPRAVGDEGSSVNEDGIERLGVELRRYSRKRIGQNEGVVYALRRYLCERREARAVERTTFTLRHRRRARCTRVPHRYLR